MKMRCTMLSLVLCALATTAAAAAPGRHAKLSAADAAHAVEADGADTVAARRPRKGTAPEARKTKARDERDAGQRGARKVESDDDDTPGRHTPRRRTDADTAATAAADDADTPSERDREARDRADEVAVKVVKPRHQGHRNVFYFVAGVAHIDARVASGGLQLDPAGLASLAAMPGPVHGSVASDPSNLIAGMIGFAPAMLHGYVAFETVIAAPKTTKLRATGDLANKSLAPTALGFVPTGIPPLGSELGEVKATPPMVTAIFRLPALGPLRFYAGGGASILFVRDAKITNPVLTQVATPKLEVTPAVGAVGQVGVDIHLFDRFSARLDIKELWFQPSQATISNIRVHTTIPMLETVDVGSAKSVLHANPIVVQAGIGASF